jgi:hypothetical protein
MHSLKQILLVEVWFDLRKGGSICLPRITQPEASQQLILHHLDGRCPSNHPPSTAANTTLCGRPEAFGNLRCLKISNLQHF